MILRFLKIILIVAVILVITISIILLLLSMQPFVPNNYTQIVKTGGELEAKYLAMGASQVEHMEVSTEEEWEYQCLLPQGVDRERQKLSCCGDGEWHGCV